MEPDTQPLATAHAGYCRCCNLWHDALLIKGKSSVLAGLGYPEEAKRMLLCPHCFEQMEAWIKTVHRQYKLRLPLTAQHRAKLSAAQTGKELSEQHRQAISAGNIGKEHYQYVPYLTAQQLSEGRELLRLMINSPNVCEGSKLSQTKE